MGLSAGLTPCTGSGSAHGETRAKGTPSTTGPDARTAKMHGACQEFESLFLSHLLKTMRASTEALGPGEDIAGSGLLREIADEHLARALAKGGGLGLADLLEQRFAAQTSRAVPDGTQSEPALPRASAMRRRIGEGSGVEPSER